MVTEVFDLLPITRETWTVSQAPNFGLVQPLPLLSEAPGTEDLCLSTLQKKNAQNTHMSLLHRQQWQALYSYTWSLPRIREVLSLIFLRAVFAFPTSLAGHMNLSILKTSLLPMIGFQACLQLAFAGPDQMISRVLCGLWAGCSQLLHWIHFV